MSVYVDDAFCSDDPDGWGKWTGGGHLQADTLEELHDFARRLGLQRSWFQSKSDRPDHDHYDLTKNKRRQAIELGAISEGIHEAVERREKVREAHSGN